MSYENDGILMDKVSMSESSTVNLDGLSGHFDVDMVQPLNKSPLKDQDNDNDNNNEASMFGNFIAKNVTQQPVNFTKQNKIESINNFEDQNMVYNLEEGPAIRKPVLKRALAPCLFVMKLFGLYASCDNGRGKLFYRLRQLYMVFINLVLFADFAFSINSVIQGFTLLRLSRNCATFCFIERLEAFLTDIKLCNCRLVERRFMRKSWLNFVVNVTGIVLFCLAVLFMEIFNESSEVEASLHIQKTLLSNEYMIYAKMLADMVLLAAWITPIALCVVLINSLTYSFEEFYRYIQYTRERKGDGVSTRGFLRDIRLKFIRLTQLCDDFDDMMSLMLMFSYLVDIIMSCLLLRMMAFAYTDVVSKAIAGAWLLLPVFSLMSISRQASHLYDTGLLMRKHIQEMTFEEMTLEDKTELDLLIFHISGEPVVMTIWKMIPLNRSIIVSIFVSILTYFAMLISFM